MDELVQHCLKELAFDGDLGSNISRLKDFISGFYEQECKEPLTPKQVVDDSFSALVWSIIVQQPDICIGTVPSWNISEVYIAPQQSAKKKVKKDGEIEEEQALPALELLQDAHRVPLRELLAQYGDTLRVAVSPQTIFKSITGSPFRPPKLTPMVYTALQLITRGRESGMSVVDLGKRSGYDQKTCFYLIKQLDELGLIVKLRRAGVGANLCLHKYFYERSLVWSKIREETSEAIAQAGDDIEENGNDNPIVPREQPQYDPIDARHISSLPLIQARLVNLLKRSEDRMCKANNLILTLGFQNPTKTDRRFFATRLKELENHGIIERISLPGKSSASPSYVRLPQSDTKDSSNASPIGSSESWKEQNSHLSLFGPDGSTMVSQSTLHVQILDHLKASGCNGLTLSELSACLGKLDKRIFELLLLGRGIENSLPPKHLLDLAVVGLMETKGREHRHRFYTLGSAREVNERENLGQEKQEWYTADLSHVGEFAEISADAFYPDDSSLHRFQDEFQRGGKKKGESKKRKRGGPDGSTDGPQAGPSEVLAKRKRGRPPKKKPDDAIATAPATTTSSNSVQTLKRRGRPPKKKPEVVPNPENEDLPFTEGQNRIETSPCAPDGRDHSTVVQNKNFPIPPLNEIQTSQDVSAPLGSDHAASLVPNPAAGRDNMQTNVIEPTICLTVPDRSDGTSSTVEYSAENCADDSIYDPLSVANAMDIAPIGHSNLKRDLVDTELDSSRKRSKPEHGNEARGRTNVSHARRENELLEVVLLLGGVAQVNNKSMVEAHESLVATKIRAGEPTSTPLNVKLDKRTVGSTINRMIFQGKLKSLKSTLSTPAGSIRQVHLVYLPDTSQDAIATFLGDLSRPPSVDPSLSKKISRAPDNVIMRVTPSAQPTTSSPLPNQALPGMHVLKHWDQDEGTADVLFCQDDTMIREELLREHTTLSQLYGFIIGRCSRAQRFHLDLLDAFQREINQSGITSAPHRIVHLDYLTTELSVAQVCAFIAFQFYDPALVEFLSNPDSSHIPLKSAPLSIRNALQLARSRGRTRLRDILELLWGLDLVRPLKPSTSDTFDVQGYFNDDNLSFDYATATDDISSIDFWMFTTKAPIHLWSLSQTDPPRYKTLPIGSVQEGELYWKELRESVHMSLADTTQVQCTTPSVRASHDQLYNPSKTARTIRRNGSWKSDYSFTWLQRRYMRRFIGENTGELPSDEGTRETLLNKIAWVVSAPLSAVKDFISEEKASIIRDISKSRAKSARTKAQQVRTEAANDDNATSRIAIRAARDKAKKKGDWEALVKEVHPGPIEGLLTSRLAHVRSRYLRASTGRGDQPKWRAEISNAIRETQVAASMMAKSPRVVPKKPLPPPITNAGAKSVRTLIDQQGPALQPKPTKPRAKNGRKKRVGDDDDENPAPEQSTDLHKQRRRTRFHWNAEYDELALDATAIIRARWRYSKKQDLSAYEIIFPAVPRNSVRQRVTSLRESSVTDAYMKRLEDYWHDLWIVHRGTDVLPDPDQDSASNFDVIAHLEFLRRHVDKTALRVGFVLNDQDFVTKIPGNVETLYDQWTIDEPVATSPVYDFMWQSFVEEGREKSLLNYSNVMESEAVPQEDLVDNATLYTEGALKMLFSAPDSSYDADAGSLLVRDLKEYEMNIAMSRLTDNNVLSKVSWKPHPGRLMRISEPNQKISGGPISKDVFQDASTLEEISADHEGEWRDWSLLAADGDLAVIIQLTSEDKMDFKIDTRDAQVGRAVLDWNSKKADDVHLEIALSVRFRDLSLWSDLEDDFGPPLLETIPSAANAGATSPSTHGTNKCCKRGVMGLVDCPVCLQNETTGILKEVEDEQIKAEYLAVIETVKTYGPDGVSSTHPAIRQILQSDNGNDIVNHLVTAPIPILFWTGYTDVVLVSSEFLSAWTVAVSAPNASPSRVFPRRWLNLNGEKIVDTWTAALRAHMGIILLHPGISHAQLRWHLRDTYDRREIHEIMCYLVEEGFTEPRTALTDKRSPAEYCQRPLNDEEEQVIFWFLHGSRHWYHVA